ncbi:MAG: response regulator transcription factor [Flavobacteriales bacterium]|nr:response regulator transcription factor [Flavobacteriales bacterium]
MGKEKQDIHILLAEDDSNLGFVVQDNLKSNGYKVTLCPDGETALRTFANDHFDLCILDVMMPKKDGFEVAKTIRDVNKEVPIVFLTAKTMQEDKVKGFMLGADDYITKPFDFQEFILRIESILRRTKVLTQKEEEVVGNYKIGSYDFDIKNQVLIHPSEEKRLTKKETRILSFLCEHLNDIAPRELILKNIWGTDDYFSGRSMDVFISKLRKYLSKDESIQISNIHGVGFKLEVKS